MSDKQTTLDRVEVNGMLFVRCHRIEQLATGSYPAWPQGVIVNGWVYWRRDL